MFETTGVPAGWVDRIESVDEVWVPSRWGLSRFVAAGVPAAKLVVIPEAIDTVTFDPSRVEPLYKIMRGADQYFAFLSVFKWEERKNFRTLIAAFLLEFSAKDKAKLFIRSGRQVGLEGGYDGLCVRDAISQSLAGARVV
jgi:glycosyltransferase involved in cell wall biosynthesis